jgi:hypothetical protein
MKIRLGIAIYLCSVLVAQADPVEGLWKTKPDDNGDYGHVLIIGLRLNRACDPCNNRGSDALRFCGAL